MDIQCISSLKDISPEQWDTLRPDKHPLLSHAFLYGMEQHGCLSPQSGWQPRYIVLRENSELQAAMLLYEKTNSWGEFVFDHAWADAYMRYGLNYFPKLVSSIPFTPVFGNNFLAHPSCDEQTFSVLLDAARQVVKQAGCSSLHILFPPKQEQIFFDAQDLIQRVDCQYHWHNQNYANFDAFTAKLMARKRKNIRREREKVRAQGITFRHLNGKNATSEDWALFTHFYNLTYERKWGAPIFNQAFFESTASALGEQMILVLADKGGESIAGALMYKSDAVLYGRHWGCSEFYDGLHFETCYYQGIEICIEQGLHTFEPGAQGEHKHARGFEPVFTRSYHWLAEARFDSAIKQFCMDESAAVKTYVTALKQRSPYK